MYRLYNILKVTVNLEEWKKFIEALCLSTHAWVLAQNGAMYMCPICNSTECKYLLYFTLSDATLKHIYSREWVCKAMACLGTNRKSVQTGTWYPL